MLYSSPTFESPLKSILIVDGDGIIIEQLSLGFKKCGFKVFKAESGLNAWNLFNSDPVNLVLIGNKMPGLNAKELSRRIRNHSPLTKIALMTDSEADEVKELLNDETADYYFPKPFNIKNICIFSRLRFRPHDWSFFRY